jgi:hypothetical protein
MSTLVKDTMTTTVIWVEQDTSFTAIAALSSPGCRSTDALASGRSL